MNEAIDARNSENTYLCFLCLDGTPLLLELEPMFDAAEDFLDDLAVVDAEELR